MYEDYLRTVLRVEVKHAPAPAPEQDGRARRGDLLRPVRRPTVPPRCASRRRARPPTRRAPRPRVPRATPAPGVRTYRKSESGDPYANVGRNDPCPCGSGKKFKNCHGRNR